MYIPLWIIVIGVIVYFFWSKNKEKAEDDSESNITERKIKWIDVNSLDLAKVERLLKNHENKILSNKEDIDKIKQEREKFQTELGLGQRIWRFIEDVRHYHIWYENSKKDDKKPFWKSTAMSPEVFVLEKFSSSSLNKLINNSDDFRKDDEIIKYSFKVGENQYILFINENAHVDHGNTRGYITFHSVIVFENAKRIVYQSKIYQDSNEGGYSYSYDELEAFKPDLWVKFLLEKMFDIRKEYEQFMKELSEENKKFFNKIDKEKFVD